MRGCYCWLTMSVSASPGALILSHCIHSFLSCSSMRFINPCLLQSLGGGISFSRKTLYLLWNLYNQVDFLLASLVFDVFNGYPSKTTVAKQSHVPKKRWTYLRTYMPVMQTQDPQEDGSKIIFGIIFLSACESIICYSTNRKSIGTVIHNLIYPIIYAVV